MSPAGPFSDSLYTSNKMNANGAVGDHLANGKLRNGNVATIEMANGNANSFSNLRARYDRMIDQENEKTKFLTELMSRFETLNEQYRDEVQATSRERQLYAQFQKVRETLEGQVAVLTSALERDPFVLILIDADGMVFQDEFIRAGETGGRQAAARLQSAIMDYIHKEAKNVPTSSKIVCRAYANFRGLSNTLVSNTIIPDANTFYDFTLGFTRGRTLFDFVDVGPGKDRADDKLIETFKLYIHDYHCRHVFFGCSHDNGYARALEDLAMDATYLDKITLMEGLPFGKELLMLPFKTNKIDGLFRTSALTNLLSTSYAPPTADPGTNGTAAPTTNLANGANGATVSNGYYTPPVGKVIPVYNGLPSRFPAPGAVRQSSAPQTPTMGRASPDVRPDARTPSGTVFGISAVESKAPPVMNWAAKAAAPPPIVEEPSYKPCARDEVIARNRAGQRVDPPCRDYDKAEVDRVKKIKLCNVHFLRRECPYGTNCTHRHDYEPANAEIQVLKLVARMAPCINGSHCQDIKCIYGHRCPAPESRTPVKGSKTCIFGKDCKFPVELHNLDANVVKTLVIR
ncbi:hypothetical protein BCR34DRAFT_552579 [Clohesyomyces aquaticus]|uniref:C3H1-type domain-containing protein n=1 Tax=Clohesyomyces aquaticus TaxID=1231657 RepID=A0A1Y2AAS8_9PLEO|nr:hypothetical protein BCR34DRAFT_552579 [Clohesyomyces aquaticus]